MIFVYLYDMSTLEVISTIIGTTISCAGCTVWAMNFLLKRERNIALRDKKIEDVESKEITLNDVCFILGIPLRDRYIREIIK